MVKEPDPITKRCLDALGVDFARDWTSDEGEYVTKYELELDYSLETAPLNGSFVEPSEVVTPSVENFAGILVQNSLLDTDQAGHQDLHGTGFDVDFLEELHAADSDTFVFDGEGECFAPEGLALIAHFDGAAEIDNTLDDQSVLLEGIEGQEDLELQDAADQLMVPVDMSFDIL